jgi:hypothetical protein
MSEIIESEQRCVHCESPDIYEHEEAEAFQSGTAPVTVRVRVPVISCRACGQSWTDWRAAAIRDAAHKWVRAGLNTRTLYQRLGEIEDDLRAYAESKDDEALREVADKVSRLRGEIVEVALAHAHLLTVVEEEPLTRTPSQWWKNRVMSNEGLPERAWHIYRLHTLPGGEVEGEWSTNDDDDDGIPDGKTTYFSRVFRGPDAMAKARAWTGVSRVGVSGVVVTVFVDGTKI